MTTTRSKHAVARLIAAATVLGIIAALPGVAEAHAEPERSNPAAGSVIPRSPDAVEIWFTQELFRRAGANTIVVEGPSGRVNDGEAVIDGADREHLTVSLLPDLPAGEYTVSWTSLSAIDGDAAEGTFSFTIDPTAPEPTAPAVESPTAATPTPGGGAGGGDTPASGGGGDGSEVAGGDSDGTSFPTWVLVAAAAILGSAGLGAWALLRGDDGAGGSAEA